MKPNPSIVFLMFQALAKWYHIQVYSSIVSHGSSLCKNETIPTLHLLIVVFISHFFPNEPWFFHSIVTISLAGHTLSLICFTLAWGTSAMSGLISQHLDLYMFWVVPSWPEPLSILLYHSFFQLESSFNSQNMKILSITCLFELVKVNEKTSTQYKFKPFSD